MGFARTEIGPDQCRNLISSPGIAQNVWCYEYKSDQHPWVLSIATLGEPGSEKLSLGGFRIVPAERVAAVANFSPSKEAIGLGLGMEEKVFWSRHLRVGGELGKKNIDRIVGGKCVLLPAKGARVGEPRDKELLDFALECLHDFETLTKVYLTTGQDLGHGILSDGRTSSLDYMSARFRGCIRADTSKPTAEGNFRMLEGILRGCSVSPAGARILIVGLGNIGTHLAARLSSLGCKLECIEHSPNRIEQAKASGIVVHPPEQMTRVLGGEFDAVAFNANGGSLTRERIAAINNNQRLKIVCGCENLLFSEGASVTDFTGSKIVTPTELCGMMGYLTAVEEYLRKQAGREFAIEEMYAPAKQLENIGFLAAQGVIQSGYQSSFEQCVRQAGIEY